MADDVIDHTRTIAPTIVSPSLLSRYTGFSLLSGVCVYELAIKTILVEFARQRDRVFCNFIEESFKKLNARITLNHLKNDYLKKFGNNYLDLFILLLDSREMQILNSERKSIKNCYSNTIQWRHIFVHEGLPPQYATFNEVVDSYELGKNVIDCFASALIGSGIGNTWLLP